MYKINNCYKEFISNREAILARLNSNGLTLKFLWKNPDESIVSAFSKEPFFQLYFASDVMFLLVKFNTLKWVDIPCVFTKAARSLFSYTGENFPVRILLANSNTGKLFADESYTMAKGTTKAFIQNIHTQKDLTKKQILEKINNIRSSYSSTEMARLSLGKAK